VVAADVNHRVRVVVRFTDGAGNSESATSAGTAVVPPAQEGIPNLTATLHEFLSFHIPTNAFGGTEDGTTYPAATARGRSRSAHAVRAGPVPTPSRSVSPSVLKLDSSATSQTPA